MFAVVDVIVVGVQLARVREDPKRAVVIDPGTVDRARGEVLALLREMGLAEREVCLIPYVFVC